MPGRKLQSVMPKTPANHRAEAELRIAAVDDPTILPAERAAIVEALTADLGAAEHALGLEARLLKIEAQVQTLTETVAHITDAIAQAPYAAMRRHLVAGERDG